MQPAKSPGTVTYGVAWLPLTLIVSGMVLVTRASEGPTRYTCLYLVLILSPA